MAAVAVVVAWRIPGTAQGDHAGRDASCHPADTATPTGIGRFAVIQYMALSLGVESSQSTCAMRPKVERAVTAFAGTATTA